MNDTRWKRVRYIFEGALALPDNERERYLRDVCQDDPSLVAEVLKLLEAESEPNVLLDGIALDALPDEISGAEPATREGQTIGHYRLGRRLGVGGMGEVYVAERTDFAQTVALKLLRSGADDARLVERLAQERTILARLEHPNIARLYDGGVSEEGLPYFTMELVDGLPIDQYCDRRELSLNARVDLFREVCAAVRYAQERLIVHRDLKPSNILVTGDGAVRLLDFGIARLLEEGRETLALVTATGQLQPFTPAFASPEQIRGETITTATDVYALGMVLYQLLCGEPPYRVPDSTPLALERAITETMPEPPSTRVSAPRRSRALQGDLDNICMKALRKEPERRYASAAELTEDLANYRARRPVAARRDSLGYRMSKFAQRNRRGLLAAMMALVTFVALITAYTMRLATERDLAREERVHAEELTELLIDIFSAGDPSEARSSELSARELLDRGSERIRQRLRGQPKRQAQIELVLGRIYRGLGDNATSEEFLSRAWHAHEDLGNPVAAAEAQIELAWTVGEIGRSAEAESLTIDAIGKLREHLPDDDERIVYAVSRRGLALHRLGRYAEAEQAYREADEIWKRVDVVDASRVIANQNNLALLHVDTDRLDQARTLYESLLERARVDLGDDHPEYGTALYNYSDVLRRLGDRLGARRTLHEVLALDERTYGRDHPMLGHDHLSLGRLQESDGLLDEARASFQRALDLFEAADPKYSEIPIALSHLGRIAQAREEFDLAEDYFQRSLALHHELQGSEHAYIPIRLNDIGSLQRARGQLKESEATLRDALKRNLVLWGEEHSQVAQTRYLLAKTLSDSGQHERAIEMARRAVAIAERAGVGETDALVLRLGLADALRAAGEIPAAQDLFAACEREYARRMGPDDLQRAVALFGLGECAAARDDRASALQYHEEVLRIRQQILPSDSAKLRMSRARVDEIRGG